MIAGLSFSRLCVFSFSEACLQVMLTGLSFSRFGICRLIMFVCLRVLVKLEA